MKVLTAQIVEALPNLMPTVRQASHIGSNFETAVDAIDAILKELNALRASVTTVDVNANLSALANFNRTATYSNGVVCNTAALVQASGAVSAMLQVL